MTLTFPADVRCRKTLLGRGLGVRESSTGGILYSAEKIADLGSWGKGLSSRMQQSGGLFWTDRTSATVMTRCFEDQARVSK